MPSGSRRRSLAALAFVVYLLGTASVARAAVVCERHGAGPESAAPPAHHAGHAEPLAADPVDHASDGHHEDVDCCCGGACTGLCVSLPSLGGYAPILGAPTLERLSESARAVSRLPRSRAHLLPFAIPPPSFA